MNLHENQIISFSVGSHYVMSGQTDHHKGQAHLKNLLHAWRKLQLYKKLKKERLKMARHKLRDKTRHEKDQKAKHREKHKRKHQLKAAKMKSREHALKDREHLRLHHHRKIIRRNGTRHDHAAQKNRSHKNNSKEKAAFAHSNKTIIKKGI